MCVVTLSVSGGPVFLRQQKTANSRIHVKNPILDVCGGAHNGLIVISTDWKLSEYILGISGKVTATAAVASTTMAALRWAESELRKNRRLFVPGVSSLWLPGVRVFCLTIAEHRQWAVRNTMWTTRKQQQHTSRGKWHTNRLIVYIPSKRFINKLLGIFQYNDLCRAFLTRKPDKYFTLLCLMPCSIPLRERGLHFQALFLYLPHTHILRANESFIPKTSTVINHNSRTRITEQYMTTITETAYSRGDTAGRWRKNGVIWANARG